MMSVLRESMCGITARRLPEMILTSSDDLTKGSPDIPGGPSKSKPAWSRT